MTISKELILGLFAEVEKLMIRNVKMEEYIRSLRRPEDADFSFEDEVLKSDQIGTANEEDIQKIFRGIRDTIERGSDPDSGLRQVLAKLRVPN
jgi:hypothetical protein